MPFTSICTTLVVCAALPAGATPQPHDDSTLTDPVRMRTLSPRDLGPAFSAPVDLAAHAEPREFRLDFGMAQDEPVVPVPSRDNPWRADAYLWIWLVGIEGDLGVRGRTVDTNVNFLDILDASDSLFAFSGRLEVAYDRLGVFVDGTYARLGFDDVSGPLELARVDVTFDMLLLDFGLMYRIGIWEPTGAAAKSVYDTTLDLYAGARYTDLELEIDPANFPAISGSRDWIDPIVGAKLTLPIAERWHLKVNGDIGGFGVSSDFTWSATGVLGYDFTLFEQPASVYLGYRGLGQDYSSGSGDTKFTWDVIQHGPLLGLSLRF